MRQDVDIGECIEDTFIREVKEEVGLDIKNISYFKVNPGHFPDMILAFIAEADEEQTIWFYGNKIIQVACFDRINLSNYPPNKSIAGEIIEKFRNRNYIRFVLNIIHLEKMNKTKKL